MQQTFAMNIPMENLNPGGDDDPDNEPGRMDLNK
jgi:hypothetical protein